MWYFLCCHHTDAAELEQHHVGVFRITVQCSGGKSVFWFICNKSFCFLIKPQNRMLWEHMLPHFSTTRQRSPEDFWNWWKKSCWFVVIEIFITLSLTLTHFEGVTQVGVKRGHTCSWLIISLRETHCSDTEEHFKPAKLSVSLPFWI